MSADPKSLATLAIATSSEKKSSKRQSSNIDDLDDGDRDIHIQNFRSTHEFIAGWTAAFINTTALFPMNKLIFRQMAGGHKVFYAGTQMKEEGIRYLYRGILPPLIQKMFSVSIMFGSFGHYKKWADKKFTNSLPVANLALAACLTGATEAVLTPLERVQMLLQDRRFHKEYKNTRDALYKLRKFGYSEYYRGLTCVLVRNGPSNILFFGLRDEIKKMMRDWSPKNKKTLQSQNPRQQSQPGQQNDDINLNQTTTNLSNSLPYSSTLVISTNISDVSQNVRVKDSMIHDFLSGAILGMFISTLFYPLSVVRTRMQTRAPGTEFLSIVKAFNAVYSERDRKFTRLFHGCLINVLRQFASWGIINCSYEYVLDWLHNAD